MADITEHSQYTEFIQRAEPSIAFPDFPLLNSKNLSSTFQDCAINYKND